MEVQIIILLAACNSDALVMEIRQREHNMPVDGALQMANHVLRVRPEHPRTAIAP